jgi:hypothetical protein
VNGEVRAAVYCSDDAALSSHRLYPRLYKNATAGALASGLFNPAKQRDRLLLRADRHEVWRGRD